VLVPLAGWTATSSCCGPVNLFWSVPMTLPVSGEESFAKAVFWIHYALAFTLLGLVALHVAGALQHHLVRRDDTLSRMLPESPPAVRHAAGAGRGAGAPAASSAEG
jgi:cytochrome b561